MILPTPRQDEADELELSIDRAVVGPGHGEMAALELHGKRGHRRALGKSYLPAVLDDAGALP
jgi:hypothetical protein